MRLWHVDLISVLPRQQLCGQWRELNSIFKNKNRHILINFVYDYPKGHLINYSLNILAEMGNRGYKYNVINLKKYFDGISYKYIENPFPDKMTDKYFAECYFNLMEKYECGGVTEEEWRKIEKIGKTRVREWILKNL